VPLRTRTVSADAFAESFRAFGPIRSQFFLPWDSLRNSSIHGLSVPCHAGSEPDAQVLGRARCQGSAAAATAGTACRATRCRTVPCFLRRARCGRLAAHAPLRSAESTHSLTGGPLTFALSSALRPSAAATLALRTAAEQSIPTYLPALLWDGYCRRMCTSSRYSSSQSAPPSSVGLRRRQCDQHSPRKRIHAYWQHCGYARSIGPQQCRTVLSTRR
jgi:hypothetical protein